MRKLELYIDKDGENLRCGYTTGSCAAAATKGAAIMLLNKQKIAGVEISTPAGIDLLLPLNNIEIGEDFALCSVTKDGGDDADSTDGMEIFSKVTLREDEEINISGGIGIGRITKKGIYGEIGDYAINPVPRQMIEKELRKVSSTQGFNVEIFAPEGVEVSKRTFNKNIGIEGGISIIGTKGIVYPMSEDAFIKTIYLEIKSIAENYGVDGTIVLTPGNYGVDFAKEEMNLDHSVKISNFIGKSLKYAYKLGFRRFYLIGHVGKFAKLSLGAYNTHNEVVDLRMEAFVYYMALDGVEREILEEIDLLLSAEEATEYLVSKNLGYIIKKMEKGAEERIKKYLKDDDIEVGVRMYSMKRGVKFD
ncbi:MAG: cobalamin biosynthesis protein CbiD [Tissierellia bacterium]|nr:cobalamin biosynthesis protein CbiD [Tissierellia bacterium]